MTVYGGKLCPFVCTDQGCQNKECMFEHPNSQPCTEFAFNGFCTKGSLCEFNHHLVFPNCRVCKKKSETSLCVGCLQKNDHGLQYYTLQCPSCNDLLQSFNEADKRTCTCGALTYGNGMKAFTKQGKQHYRNAYIALRNGVTLNQVTKTFEPALGSIQEFRVE